MKTTFFIGLFFVLTSTLTFASGVPFHPTAIDNFSADAKVGTDVARIKVSFALSERDDDNAIRLGGIVLCSDSGCYRPMALNYFNAGNTSKGTATLAVDAVMPYGKLSRIYFDDISGAKVVAGSIQLTAPLLVEKGYYGGEIFITLSKQKSAKQVIYRPSGVASGLFHHEAQSVYYDPGFSTRATLPLSTILTIPAAALPMPQIFSVGVADIGKQYPQIDIFPYIALSKVATLNSMPLARSAKAAAEQAGPNTAKSVPPFAPVPGFSMPAQNDGNNSKLQNKEKTFSKTGLFNFSGVENPQSSTIAATCDQIIAYPPNLKIIKDTTGPNGAAYVNWCENIPPYVSIVYVNTADSRIRYSIPNKLEASGGVYKNLLQPITTAAAPAMAAVNGFTWTGDEGTGANQHGLALGYVNNNGIAIGANRQGGGVSGGTGASDGNKFVMAYGANLSLLNFFETAIPNANFGSYANTVVSSSTSVVKYGNCSGDTLDSRWSAVGAAAGKMVLMSSFTGNTTTAAQLCPVFKALEISNALRLDGGPSAAMALGGTHINPLSGLYRLKYGSIRYTIYPLKITSN
jgi:hypothetical protein